MMNLDEWDKLLSIGEHGATILALAAGGWWALHHFVLYRERQWNLVIDVTPTFHEYASGLSLLTASITLRNVGKVKVCPAGAGCWFSLKCLPAGLQLASTPHWNEGVPLVDRLSVIHHSNPDHIAEMNPLSENYTLEPAAEFVETVNVVVPKATLLMAEVGFQAGVDGEAVWIYRVWRTPPTTGRGRAEETAPILEPSS